MKLDSRVLSQKAHTALIALKSELESENCDVKKASNVVQGLSSYISTWGLHRLSGDMQKFIADKKKENYYKGVVYQKFLCSLRENSENFNIKVNTNDENNLINLDLRRYTGLNRLAIQLAREWSFWAVAVLGEAKS